jgi:hypothetical protein
MRLREKFRLFSVFRVAVGSLLPALALVFVFGGAAVSPAAAASAMLPADSGTHAGATLGETPRSVRIAAPRAPDRPATCFDRHHPCGPGVIPAAHGEPFSAGPTRLASVAAPRGPEQVPVPDVAPHATASLSILFRNFRN